MSCSSWRRWESSGSRRPRRRLPVLPLASSIPSLSWPEVLGRLALAAALGAVLGLERELREREAGLRTPLLVSLGSAPFTIVSAYRFREFLTSRHSVVRADPAPIAEPNSPG